MHAGRWWLLHAMAKDRGRDMDRTCDGNSHMFGSGLPLASQVSAALHPLVAMARFVIERLPAAIGALLSLGLGQEMQREREQWTDEKIREGEEKERGCESGLGESERGKHLNPYYQESKQHRQYHDVEHS